MIFSKLNRVIIKTVFSIALLILPLYSQFYHIPIYYIGVILLIILLFLTEIFNWDKKLNERFFARWRRSREKGFWINSMWSAVRSFVFMIVVVSLGQFFGNGLAPMDVVCALPSSAIPKILLILIIFSFIIGIFSWYESEKRYNKICKNKKKMKVDSEVGYEME